jgi:hypothetical protein
MTEFLKQLHARRRKWYIQPLDAMSSQEIYKLTEGSEKIYPRDAIGPPKNMEKDGHHLALISFEKIKELMSKTSLGALDCPITDFGLNFYIYAKEMDEDKPRYRFASTSRLRKENAIQYNNNRPKPSGLNSKNKAKLKKVPSKPKPLPTFTLKTNRIKNNAICEENIAPEKAKTESLEKMSLKYRNILSLYRISTHHTLVLNFLIDELTKINKTTEPIPGLKIGPGKTESVYDVPASVVLEMKVKANHRFLHFGIWKKNDKNEYVEIERYPHFVK